MVELVVRLSLCLLVIRCFSSALFPTSLCGVLTLCRHPPARPPPAVNLSLSTWFGVAGTALGESSRGSGRWTPPLWMLFVEDLAAGRYITLHSTALIALHYTNYTPTTTTTANTVHNATLHSSQYTKYTTPQLQLQLQLQLHSLHYTTLQHTTTIAAYS